MSGTILIYGAAGYTGKLIAKAAVDHGALPILAGRDPGNVEGRMFSEIIAGFLCWKRKGLGGVGEDQLRHLLRQRRPCSLR